MEYDQSMDKFEVRPLKIKDACAVTLKEYTDDYGSIVECFNVVKSLPKPSMPQLTVSRSNRNVIRGMHCSPHHKLVLCPTGRAFDVVVDLRPDSPTFLQWDGTWIDRTHHMFIPPYCGHGFFAAEDDTSILYLQGGCFAPQLDFSLKYDDPRVAIQWPSPIEADDYIISPKDLSNPYFTPELEAQLRERQSDPTIPRKIAPCADFALISLLSPNITQAIQNKESSAHLCFGDGLRRDTLECEMNTIRPKVGAIAFCNTDKDIADNFIGIMNLVHVCYPRGIHLTLIMDTKDFPGSNRVYESIEGNVLIITTNLRKGTGVEDSSSLISEALARNIIEMASQGTTGFFSASEDGSINPASP